MVPSAKFTALRFFFRLLKEKPELGASILQHTDNGGFHSVGEVVLQALEAAFPLIEPCSKANESRTGADLIAALQSSPYREIDIEPARYRLPVRDVSL